MRKIIFSVWLLLLVLVLPACRQDRDHEEPVEEEYVTLMLDTEITENGDAGDLRQSGVLVNRTIDDKIRMNFSREDGGQTRTVTTIITNGEGSWDTEIFRGELEWKITQITDASGVTGPLRLTYKGPLRIKAKDLENVEKLMIYAHTGSVLKNGEYQDDAIRPIRKGEHVYLDIPFFMITEVEQQGKKLVIKDHTNAKFRPRGYIVRLNVKNSLPFYTAIHKLIVGGYFFSYWGYNYDDFGGPSSFMFLNGAPGTGLVVQRDGRDAINIRAGESDLQFVFWVTSAKHVYDFEQDPYAPPFFPVFGQIVAMAHRRDNKPVKDGSVVNYDVEYKLANGFNPDINNVGTIDSRSNNTFYLSQVHLPKVSLEPGVDFDILGGGEFSEYGQTYMPIPDNLLGSVGGSPSPPVEEESYMTGYTSVPSLSQLSYYIPYFWPINNWPKDMPHFRFQNSADNLPPGVEEFHHYKTDETLSVGNQVVRGTSIFKFPHSDKEETAADQSPAVYALRLKDTPYRVFQRWTTTSLGHDIYFCVSFLKYDEAAVNESRLENCRAFTAEYWHANKSKIQTIIFPALSGVPAQFANNGPRAYTNRITDRLFLRSYSGKYVTMAWDRFGPYSEEDEYPTHVPIYPFRTIMKVEP